MKCSKCGFELEATDRICKSCGELNRDNPDNVHIMSLMKHSTNARTNAFQKSIDQNRLRETMPKPEPKEPPKRSSEIIQETRELTEVEKIMMQEGNTYNPTAETPTYYPQHKRTNTDRDYSNEPLLETKKVIKNTIFLLLLQQEDLDCILMLVNLFLILKKKSIKLLH